MKNLFRLNNRFGWLPTLRHGVIVACAATLLLATLCPVSVSAMGQDLVWADPGMDGMACPVQAIQCAVLSSAFHPSGHYLKNPPGPDVPFSSMDRTAAFVSSEVVSRPQIRDPLEGIPLHRIPLYLLHASLIR